MVYIKFIHKETGETKKLRYPRLVQAQRAARVHEKGAWDLAQMWKIEGIYYDEAGRVADPTFTPRYHEGLAKST